ncbi:MAG: hypothetical protein IKF99_14755 [Oscillospiraceae bacterium]|nr:hypothetical protein [Oscillospiraceae bacterium]
MMNVQKENLVIALSDAGFSQEVIEKAERLWEAGRARDLIRHLRLCRCELMDILHESQKRVDRVDTLIRQTEKTMETK